MTGNNLSFLPPGNGENLDVTRTKINERSSSNIMHGEKINLKEERESEKGRKEKGKWEKWEREGKRERGKVKGPQPTRYVLPQTPRLRTPPFPPHFFFP